MFLEFAGNNLTRIITTPIGNFVSDEIRKLSFWQKWSSGGGDGDGVLQQVTGYGGEKVAEGVDDIDGGDRNREEGVVVDEGVMRRVVLLVDEEDNSFGRLQEENEKKTRRGGGEVHPSSGEVPPRSSPR
ncbi:hypothetical protein QVD17_29641 [Tagetes erecta]|uniref:Uncharacterized protein n=1 Tax=Tagetes erecta TaxID=13708 RepID=A0AAD8JZZ2_TARER|nr:hypothetical protein QVD17_29641 [Tagetes erecta]